MDDGLAQIDDAAISALAYRSVELPPDSLIDVGFQVSVSTDLGLPRALGVLSYASDFKQDEPDGYECRMAAAAAGGTTAEVYVWSDEVVSLLDNGPFEGEIAPENRPRLRAKRNTDGKLDCVITQDASTGAAAAENILYDNGMLAIRTIRTAAIIEYVIAIGPDQP